MKPTWFALFFSALSGLTSETLAQDAFWRTDGNAGTAPGTHFLGTVDNEPLEIKVNNGRVLRIEPTHVNPFTSDMPNIIAGSSSNCVGLGVYGATIGGGWLHTIGINAHGSTIAGGIVNKIWPETSYATISGGASNHVKNGCWYGAIPGGLNNVVAGSCGLAAGRQAQSLHSGTFVWADTQVPVFASTASNQFRCCANRPPWQTARIPWHWSVASMCLRTPPALR